ncbi:LacI family DNA-binding transcriptional regulator [Salipaludibacillus aurantiacus]|uniref:LacI family transcriptional regulator, kdg operon repressor n=1 Tax=Salipaludibacillus aurantiacus TaxID=1601833 RepID=A0A1H9UDF1_9BACI|nr:substrate-binding domain-containing protein [Salipaludibacillus aurantiacus]SES07379.1 LacI family transcriptional regulator, kdg operon repressor [Salipaludibacillus aurantiacus]
MKSVTIADVAKHSKVSKSTVSQYLNQRYEYMGEETKARIQDAIKQLGYRPNIVARSLKQKSTTTIGVIVANILHAFSTQVIRAIEDVCHDYDFHTIVCNADDDPEKEKKYIEMLHAKQVDGIILFPTGGNIELLRTMKDNHFPLVLMDRLIDNVELPSVLLDNEKASSLAVEHFVEKGYSRLGIMTTSIIPNVTPRIKRVEGFKKTLKQLNLPVNDNYIKSLDLKHFEQALEDMLSLEEPPEAILAGNDLALMEMLTFIKKKKLRIPEDVALIGIDEVSFASFYNPSLTTVAQPAFKMGKKAAELLLNKIQKKDKDEPGKIYEFQPKLIERESC